MRRIILCILSLLMLCACSHQQDAAFSVSSNDIPYLFLNDDLYTAYDADAAIPLQLNDNQNIEIDEAGTYLLSGQSIDAKITISAPEESTVRLILDNITLTSTASTAIEVINTSKVQISTLSNTTNTITSNGQAISTNGTLVLNGTGTLAVTSQQDAFKAADEIIITGGNYQITSQGNGLFALKTIAVQTGSFEIHSQYDAFHCGSDSQAGFIYLQDGSYHLVSQQYGLYCQGKITIENTQMTIEAQNQSIHSESNLE